MSCLKKFQFCVLTPFIKNCKNKKNRIKKSPVFLFGVPTPFVKKKHLFFINV